MAKWAFVARCCERILIVLSGWLVIILGYRLYICGVNNGAVSASYGDWLVKGTGPGLLFMIAGMVLLYFCLRTPMRIRDETEGGRGTDIEIQGRPEPPPHD